MSRIFTSENGDSLLDGILSVYELFESLRALPELSVVERIVLTPRIGDVARVLNYICRTPEAHHYNVAYYYELWVHELMRVFGDRVNRLDQREAFLKELKK